LNEPTIGKESRRDEETRKRKGVELAKKDEPMNRFLVRRPGGKRRPGRGREWS
jgi:hypothetical protein